MAYFVWVICGERQKTKDTTWCTQAFPTIDTKNVIGLSYGIGARDLWSERTRVTKTGWRRATGRGNVRHREIIPLIRSLMTSACIMTICTIPQNVGQCVFFLALCSMSVLTSNKFGKHGIVHPMEARNEACSVMLHSPGWAKPRFWRVCMTAKPSPCPPPMGRSHAPTLGQRVCRATQRRMSCIILAFLVEQIAPSRLFNNTCQIEIHFQYTWRSIWALHLWTCWSGSGHQERLANFARWTSPCKLEHLVGARRGQSESSRILKLWRDFEKLGAVCWSQIHCLSFFQSPKIFWEDADASQLRHVPSTSVASKLDFCLSTAQDWMVELAVVLWSVQ